MLKNPLQIKIINNDSLEKEFESFDESWMDVGFVLIDNKIYRYDRLLSPNRVIAFKYDENLSVRKFNDLNSVS